MTRHADIIDAIASWIKCDYNAFNHVDVSDYLSSEHPTLYRGCAQPIADVVTLPHVGLSFSDEKLIAEDFRAAFDKGCTLTLAQNSARVLNIRLIIDRLIDDDYEDIPSVIFDYAHEHEYIVMSKHFKVTNNIISIL